MNRLARHHLLVSWLVLAAFAAAPSLASAADRYVATNGSDTDNDCLSQASPCLTIAHAVTEEAASGDTINIAAGTYNGAGNRAISFTEELTFQGAGKATTIIDGGGVDPLLWSQAGPITVQDLTFRNAIKWPSGGAAVAAISEDGSTYYDVLAHDIAATGNVASGDRGAVLLGNDVTVTGPASFSGNSAERGGVIYAQEEVSIDPGTGAMATFSGNVVGDSGGAIYALNGTVNVDNSTFSGVAEPGVSAGDDGGAIFVNSDTPAEFDLTVTDSTFSGFVTTGSYGGALTAYNGSASLEEVTVSDSSSAFRGGGLYAEIDARIVDSTFEGNEAPGYGGGGAYAERNAYVEGSTFRSNGDGEDNWGGGLFANGYEFVVIRDTLFEGNRGLDGGGAYLDVGTGAEYEVSNTTFRNNVAQRWGGGAYFGSDGLALVTDSTFEGNTSGSNGGGLEMNSGTIIRSTFTGNSNSSGRGSAIFMDYGPENAVENSTFTGNSGYGVIFTTNQRDPAITLEVNNVTMTGNTLDDLDYAAIGTGDGSTANLEVSNSIIAQDDGAGGAAPGCEAAGTISSVGGNVIQDTTTGCDDLIGGPPAPTTTVSAAQIGLEALALNAPGTTKTMAIGADSVASKAGVLASCLPTDQRGVSRPADSCSSGAYQYRANPRLSLSVKTPKRVKAGKAFRVRVKIRNTGSGGATAETVKTCATLPKGLSVVSRNGGTITGRKICWTRASLAAGRSAAYSFTARPSKKKSGTVKIKGSASASNGIGATVRASSTGKVKIVDPQDPRPQPPTG